MKIKRLHRWDVSIAKAIELQKSLKPLVILSKGIRRINNVAGADVAYSKSGDSAWGAVVVMDYPGLNIIEKVAVRAKVSFPYIPGLLTFREAPCLLETFKRLKTKPDLILFDGQGIAHPRGLGIASHLGIILDIPTIGCAKKRLIGEEVDISEEAGSIGLIKHVPAGIKQGKDGMVVCAKVRTKKGVRPLYISPGYMITLEEAIDVVLNTTRGYRMPEPLRMAHLIAKRVREKEEQVVS